LEIKADGTATLGANTTGSWRANPNGQCEIQWNNGNTDIWTLSADKKTISVFEKKTGRKSNCTRIVGPAIIGEWEKVGGGVRFVFRADKKTKKTTLGKSVAPGTWTETAPLVYKAEYGSGKNIFNLRCNLDSAVCSWKMYVNTDSGTYECKRVK